VATFPDDVVRGWLWPAIGFTVWFGWVAWRTGSLRLTMPAHLLTDASGLPAARFWLGRESRSTQQRSAGYRERAAVSRR
jgi:hypothetical protein